LISNRANLSGKRVVTRKSTAYVGCLFALATVVLGSPPVILSLSRNGALAWTSSYTNGITIIQTSSNLPASSWSPYYYDIATNGGRVTQLPGLNPPKSFYRLAIQTNPPDPGLVLHLPFDNTFTNGVVLDVSGHGANAYNLNLTNQVIATNGKLGQGGYWGQSYPMGDFSLGPYLAITNYSSFEFLTNGTVSVWAWPNSYSGQTTALIDAGYPGMNNSWSLRRYYNIPFEFTIWTNGSANDTHLLYFPSDIVGYPNYATADWHHYCVTWQGNGPAIAYYDGAPVATNTLPVPYLQVGSLGHWVAIGCWTHNNTDLPDGTGPNNGWMGGKMDDIRIYKRALSPTEVQDLHAAAP
jgi:hypothetical protein